MTGSPDPTHVSALVRAAVALTTSDGTPVEVWELRVDPDASYMAPWASGFRQHYCDDSEIDQLREGTGLSRSEYLTQLVFPDEHAPPGPSIRSGDFAELLISDFVEHVLGYWVPRDKFAEKGVRNESVKGVDIVGFRLPAPSSPAASDVLIAFEVKAQLTDGQYSGRLQVAIDDSAKDFLRRAETLNASKRRLRRAGNKDGAQIVQRFQNPTDHPYEYRSGAAAVLSGAAYDAGSIQATTDASQHPNKPRLQLLVVSGDELMRLAHSLYKAAADEA